MTEESRQALRPHMEDGKCVLRWRRLQPTSPREQVKETESDRKSLYEIRSRTTTFTDRQKLFEGVVKVKPACVPFIRDLRVWCLNLATAEVDMFAPVEESDVVQSDHHHHQDLRELDIVKAARLWQQEFVQVSTEEQVVDDPGAQAAGRGPGASVWRVTS